MPALKLALTAFGIALTVSRHPLVRAGIRAVADNPQAREAAVAAVKSGAYTAGVVARRIIPRSIIQ